VRALDDPEARDGGLLALRTVTEAYGGLGAGAAGAGMSRDSLYRIWCGRRALEIAPGTGR
jgi:DNA-binding phage protein